MSSPTLAGNWQDDDAEILDNLIESDAEPPEPKDLPLVHPSPVDKPKPVQRMMTGTLNVGATWDAQPLLPADPARVSVRLVVYSGTATDRLRVSDDVGKLQSVGSAFTLGVNLPVDFPYTGPVWVSCPDAIGPVTVTWVAVTA